MAGETVITIVGNLTADPELRTTRNGGAAWPNIARKAWQRACV